MAARSRAAIAALIIALATFAVAGFAGRFRPDTWYAQLNKPPWTPPDAVFAPVWIVLYAMMALAAWLAWRRGGWKHPAMVLYGAQLLLNGVWSWLFFGQHRIGWAALEIVLLWLLIVATTVAFWRVRASAALLMIPYGAWVGFAVALNLAVWHLNR